MSMRSKLIRHEVAVVKALHGQGLCAILPKRSKSLLLEYKIISSVLVALSPKRSSEALYDHSAASLFGLEKQSSCSERARNSFYAGFKVPSEGWCKAFSAANARC